jgi:hypothetical protein
MNGEKLIQVKRMIYEVATTGGSRLHREITLNIPSFLGSGWDDVYGHGKNEITPGTFSVVLAVSTPECGLNP